MLCLLVTVWKNDLMFCEFFTGYNFSSIKTDNGTIIDFGSERAICLIRIGRLISQTIAKSYDSRILISRQCCVCHLYSLPFLLGCGLFHLLSWGWRRNQKFARLIRVSRFYQTCLGIVLQIFSCYHMRHLSWPVVVGWLQVGIFACHR